MFIDNTCCIINEVFNGTKSSVVVNKLENTYSMTAYRKIECSDT